MGSAVYKMRAVGAVYFDFMKVSDMFSYSIPASKLARCALDEKVHGEPAGPSG